jgi:hypothetical protein
MYLIQLSYKNSKYRCYYGKKPEYELVQIRTLYKGEKRMIKHLNSVLNEIYFDKSNTDLCVLVNNKDELSLLLIDNFITHFAGECYDSKNGFYRELPDCTGATIYLETITKQLSLFNIDNIEIDETLQNVINETEKKYIYEEDDSDCE